MKFNIGKFKFPPSMDLRADLRSKYPDIGDLLQLFTENEGAVVHKWHHYLPLYEQYFSKWRDKPVRFLEIGVSKGGSLQVWRKFFGPEAVIFGIDILPACAALNGQAAQVRIGSQDDPDFLKSVVEEMGGLDLVLDDGSHQMGHIETSLDTLFPLLSDGGTYMIEDLHTAYWPQFGGGLAEKANFFNSVRVLMDDLHHWYHQTPRQRPTVSSMVTGIHVHDSIVVLDKAQVHRPVHSKVGQAAPEKTAVPS